MSSHRVGRLNTVLDLQYVVCYKARPQLDVESRVSFIMQILTHCRDHRNSTTILSVASKIRTILPSFEATGNTSIATRLCFLCELRAAFRIFSHYFVSLGLHGPHYKSIPGTRHERPHAHRQKLPRSSTRCPERAASVAKTLWYIMNLLVLFLAGAQ